MYIRIRKKNVHTLTVINTKLNNYFIPCFQVRLNGICFRSICTITSTFFSRSFCRTLLHFAKTVWTIFFSQEIPNITFKRPIYIQIVYPKSIPNNKLKKFTLLIFFLKYQFHTNLLVASSSITSSSFWSLRHLFSSFKLSIF